MEIKNRLGLHLRAASTLAQTVKRFNSTVTILHDGQEVNAGSVTSLIMLGAGKGTKLKVKADGPDAQKTLAALRELFDNRFGEES